MNNSQKAWNRNNVHGRIAYSVGFLKEVLVFQSTKYNEVLTPFEKTRLRIALQQLLMIDEMKERSDKELKTK